MRFPLLAAGTSAYQGLKLRVLSIVPLAKDAIHVYIGFGCYAGTVLLFRLPLGSDAVGGPPRRAASTRTPRR